MIERKLHEIARALFRVVKEHRVGVESMGLFAGKSGIILFMAHYLRKCPDREFEEIYEAYFDDFIEELTSRQQMLFTYCSGLAGVFETLGTMNASSLSELDFSDVKAAYDTAMSLWMDYSFSTQNYDFLHGGLGVSVCFRNDPKYVESTLLWLDKTATKDGRKLRWMSSLGQDRPDGFNICLSHGMSSMIIYLSRVYGSGVQAELNRKLLEGAVDYVLAQEIDRGRYGSCFPSKSLENDEPVSKSRLAWCYGDLGVAAALWQAGRATGNAAWSKKALDVFRFSAGRTDLQDAMASDAGLCHGTAGIAMMFAWIYRETSDELFGDARDHWIDRTLKMSRFPDAPAGFKRFSFEEQQVKWEDSHILLEGIAGIGFMLLATLDADAEKDLFTSFILY